MKLSILVVEDNADTRFLLRMLLEEAGHDVRTVGTVQLALAELAQWHADMLISDISLPDGTGRQLVEQLKVRNTLPFAVAISGHSSVADVNSSLAAGFRHHLSKPIKFEQLDLLIDCAEAERAA